MAPPPFLALIFSMTTRKEAVAQGLTQYHLSKPCAKGHLGMAWVAGGCAECTLLRGKRIRTTDADKARRHAHNATDKSKQTGKRNEVRRKYGITLEEYQSYFAGKTHCPICNNEFQGAGNLGTAPCLDHCHSTGKIRGAICGNCNRMLGYAKDNPDTLQRAIAYLENQGT